MDMVLIEQPSRKNRWSSKPPDFGHASSIYCRVEWL